MGAGDDGFAEMIAQIEDDYGIEVPPEHQIELLEGIIHGELVEADETLPDSLIRISGLRRLNDIYGRLQDSAEEAAAHIERVHDQNPDLSDSESETIDWMAARMFMYEDSLLFLFLAHDLIETFSIQLLEKEVILDDFQGSNRTWEVLDVGIRTDAREDLMRRMGLVSGTVKGEMSEVRKARNLLAHRTEERQRFEFGPDIMEIADSALHVLNELKLALDGERFWEEP